jgi:hypothetical protein
MYPTPSVSSTSLSLYDQSVCLPSPSASPTMSSYRELSHDRHSPSGVNRLGLTLGHFHPYPVPNSRAPDSDPSLQRPSSEASASRAQGCQSPTVTGEAPRKKRKDRHLITPGLDTIKEEKEALRRYIETAEISKLQNTTLSFDPLLPETVVHRKYRAAGAAAWQNTRNEGGWSKLKENNKSYDIEQHELIATLTHVKEDVLDRGIYASRIWATSMLAEDVAVVAEVELAIRSENPHRQLLDLLARRSSFEARVRGSVSRIGGKDWRDPSGGQRKERP